MPYETLPHTADLILRVTGSSLEELLTSAVIGMFQAIKPSYVDGSETVEREFSVQAGTLEELIVEVLNEAVSLSDANHEAYDDVTFATLTESGATGEFFGRSVTAFDVQIKAVTYHGLEVKHDTSGNWEATITFDV